jgi:hypothetical protein
LVRLQSYKKQAWNVEDQALKNKNKGKEEKSGSVTPRSWVRAWVDHEAPLSMRWNCCAFMYALGHSIIRIKLSFGMNE